jgi:hypothetical protein
MPDAIPVRVRLLPDGVPVAASEVCRNGRFLELALPAEEPGFATGSLVELQNGTVECLGEVLQRESGKAIVLLEHTIDRSRLPSIEEAWG